MYTIDTAANYSVDALNSALGMTALNTALDEAVNEYCENKQRNKTEPFVLATAYEDGMPVESAVNTECDVAEAIYELRDACADLYFHPDEIIVFLCDGESAHVIMITKQ